MDNQFCVAETLSSANLDVSDSVLVRFFGLAEAIRQARIREVPHGVLLRGLSVELGISHDLSPEDGPGRPVRCTVALQGRAPLPFPRVFMIFHRTSLQLDVPQAPVPSLHMRAFNDNMVSRFIDFCALHADALQSPSLRQTELDFELLHA